MPSTFGTVRTGGRTPCTPVRTPCAPVGVASVQVSMHTWRWRSNYGETAFVRLADTSPLGSGCRHQLTLRRLPRPVRGRSRQARTTARTALRARPTKGLLSRTSRGE
jgi:hypothetical protein